MSKLMLNATSLFIHNVRCSTLHWRTYGGARECLAPPSSKLVPLVYLEVKLLFKKDYFAFIRMNKLQFALIMPSNVLILCKYI
jgi:hypothetical protein